MPEQRPGSSEDLPSASGLEALADAEQRILGVVAALRAARVAEAEAEAAAGLLREQVRERDAEIALLRKQLESDGLRTAVRARVESLLQRVAELEREGRAQ